MTSTTSTHRAEPAVPAQAPPQQGASTGRPRRQPVGLGGRVTNLDLVRGVAVLGILWMNAVSYGLGTAPYFNLDAGGSLRWWDWVIGGLGEVLVDQKFMGLFSMLFGAGIVMFCDRLATKGRPPVPFSLWRNALLLVIGIGHTLLWDGDVLVIYAVSAPLLIALRNLRPGVLLAAGAAIVMVPPATALWAQTTVGAAGSGLGEYWIAAGTMSDPVGLFVLADFACRALGMMLIGVALYHNGTITGARSRIYYRRMAAWGLGVGLPLAAAGLALVAWRDFSNDIALVGSIPNTIGTIPAAVGYLAMISLWNLRPDSRLQARVRAVGRMALTNYLSQTVIGIIVLRGLFDPAQLSRGGITVFMLTVWALQLLWSPAWLRRFRFGPAEWLWRCATYRSWHPIVRRERPGAVADSSCHERGDATVDGCRRRP